MKSNKTLKVENVDILCNSVKKMCSNKDYDGAVQLICNNIGQFPNSPVPHNLLGIVFEKKGEHSKAMKHFRAAWALDPTYEPANCNLHNYGTFYSTVRCAFEESDVIHVNYNKPRVVCDSNRIKHIV